MVARLLINRFIQPSKQSYCIRVYLGGGSEVLITCASFPLATIPLKSLYYTRVLLLGLWVHSLYILPLINVKIQTRLTAPL